MTRRVGKSQRRLGRVSMMGSVKAIIAMSDVLPCCRYQIANKKAEWYEGGGGREGISRRDKKDEEVRFWHKN